jgi:GTP-binding protein
LSVVSNARPEIADYAFTTLTPNLGVADIDDGSLLIADIPGLIEGASEGKGLGDAFLRHVERTAVLLHLIDGYTDDIATAYQTIRSELGSYNEILLDRPEVIALTKTEGLDKDIIDMQIAAVKEVAPDAEVYAISAPAHTNLKETLRALRARVLAVRVQEAEDEIAAKGEDGDLEVITLSTSEVAKAWTIKEIEQREEVRVYRVAGHKIEKFARRTRFDTHEGQNRLRDIMKKMGIAHALRRAGAQGDSVIRIGFDELTFVEQ